MPQLTKTSDIQKILARDSVYETNTQIYINEENGFLHGPGLIIARKGIVQTGGRLSSQEVDYDGKNTATTLINQIGGDLRIQDCRMENAINYLVDSNGGSVLGMSAGTEILLDNVLFKRAKTLVRFRQSCKAQISFCTLQEWYNYNILIEGTDTFGPEARIERNYFCNPLPSLGGTRAMIFAGNRFRISNIRNLVIRYNDIVGPYQQYNDNDSNSIGTSDQVSLNFCDGFIFSHNDISGGGENGLTITNQCRNGRVFKNRISHSDGHGAQISSVGERSSDIIFNHNELIDNGLRKDGQRDTLAGIYVHDGKNIELYNNHIESLYSKYGILYSVSENVQIERNDIVLHRQDGIPIKNAQGNHP